MKKWISMLIVLVVLAGYSLYEKGFIPIFENKDTPVKQKLNTQDSNIKMPKNVVPVELDHVVDGDTVAIKFEGDSKVHSVRLLLIDTPESVKPGTPVQPFAKEASNYMKKLVSGAKLNLEYDEGGATDRYGRVLAYLYANGKNVNEMMVREGYARVAYVYKPNTRYLNEFNQAQAKAKKEKKKIWSRSGYVTESGFESK
ncbi:thermonuclease family protein [Listeria kieliensis]